MLPKRGSTAAIAFIPILMLACSGSDLSPELTATGVSLDLADHNSPTAAAAVREFLESRPDYPRRLRGKILQSADMLFRAERIVYGTTLGP